MKLAIAMFALPLMVALAQTQPLTVPLTDPNRPATVRIDSMRGDITVRGYDGKDVLINTKDRPASAAKRRPNKAEAEGLRRIELNGSSFTAEERENVVTINAGGHGSNDIDVQVPRNSNLKVKTMSGEITVDGVRGEIEANSHNGEVTMTNMEGSVVAHSLNGEIKIGLNRVEARPMSFSTMNGDIDITLPVDTKARLKLRNDRGEVYSDFEMKVQASPTVEQGERVNGRYRVKFERTVFADINGGGPEMSFVTVNGEIKIRQKK
jgi:DUF4097 and DUF4098 domain-containing protein YvlB